MNQPVKGKGVEKRALVPLLLFLFRGLYAASAGHQPSSILALHRGQMVKSSETAVGFLLILILANSRETYCSTYIKSSGMEGSYILVDLPA